MNARAIHRCIHVLNLEKSLEFYEKALGMVPVRRMGPEDRSWENVYVANEASGFQVELTWNDGREEPYYNGGKDTHLCFAVDDFQAYKKLHEEMGCICFVNERMGLYFIEDPDGCWIEIIPEDRDGNKAQIGIDVLEAIRSRRSVREYSKKPIPADKLDKVIEAGLLSASGRKLRPWELIVVEDRETLNAMAKSRKCGAAMLEGATAAIVVVAKADAADTWVEDCSIVMANMHLTADALGLGSCWIQGRMRNASDEITTRDYIADLLGIPEGYELEATLSLGVLKKAHPERNEVTEELLAKVHRERF